MEHTNTHNTKSKRNPKGTGSIRQLPNGSYEGRYTAGKDPSSGKQLQGNIYGKRKLEVVK